MEVVLRGVVEGALELHPEDCPIDAVRALREVEAEVLYLLLWSKSHSSAVRLLVALVYSPL